MALDIQQKIVYNLIEDRVRDKHFGRFYMDRLLGHSGRVVSDPLVRVERRSVKTYRDGLRKSWLGGCNL